MQPADAERATASQSVPVVRGTVLATFAAGAVWALAWAVVQMLEQGESGAGSADGVPAGALVRFAGYGVLGAALAALLAAVVHSRMLNGGAVNGSNDAASRSPGMARVIAGANVTRALVLGFACKAAALAIGIVALVILDVKFELMAAFALALAGGALLIQLLSATYLDRVLAHRGRSAARGHD